MQRDESGKRESSRARKTAGVATEFVETGGLLGGAEVPHGGLRVPGYPVLAPGLNRQVDCNGRVICATGGDSDVVTGYGCVFAGVNLYLRPLALVLNLDGHGVGRIVQHNGHRVASAGFLRGHLTCCQNREQ